MVPRGVLMRFANLKAAYGIITAAIVASIVGSGFVTPVMITMDRMRASESGVIVDGGFTASFLRNFTSFLLGYLSMMPFIFSLSMWREAYRNLRGHPKRILTICLALFFIVFFEVGLPFVPSDGIILTKHNSFFLSHILSFPLILLCGSVADTMGFTVSTLILCISAVLGALFPALKHSNRNAESNLTTQAEVISKLFRFQIMLMVVLVSNLAFLVVERARKEALEEVLRADRQKVEFMAYLCHELRNPLHAILNAVEFILEEEEDAEKGKQKEKDGEKGNARAKEKDDGRMDRNRKHFLAIIHTAGSYMVQVIHNVLDTAKLESGRVKLEPKLCDFKSLIEEVDRKAVGLAGDGMGLWIEVNGRRVVGRAGGLSDRNRDAKRVFEELAKVPFGDMVQVKKIHLERLDEYFMTSFPPPKQPQKQPSCPLVGITLSSEGAYGAGFPEASSDSNVLDGSSRVADVAVASADPSPPTERDLTVRLSNSSQRLQASQEAIKVLVDDHRFSQLLVNLLAHGIRSMPLGSGELVSCRIKLEERPVQENRGMMFSCARGLCCTCPSHDDGASEWGALEMEPRGGAARLREEEPVKMFDLEVEMTDGSDTGHVAADCEDAIQRLFDPYSIAFSERPQDYDGTGLGLVICKKIWELMGGTMEAYFEFEGEDGGRRSGWSGWWEFWFPKRAVGEDVELEGGRQRRGIKFVVKIPVPATVTAVSGSQGPGQFGDEMLSSLERPEEDPTELKASKVEPIQASEPAHPATIPLTTLQPRPSRSESTTSPAELHFKHRSSPPNPSRDSEDKNKRCIVIVDDSSINRKILERLLRRSGWPLDGLIIQCENGEEAVKFVMGRIGKFGADHGVVGIFMDLQMPVMDGFEATRRIREMLKGERRKEAELEGSLLGRTGMEELPIVAVTANAVEEHSLVEQHGFTALAPKPFLKEDAVRMLKGVLKCV
ncbi:hypothetical protein HDU97_001043 [Phlyctochytrium planicorne]|nr:hypothetical protein HDU97_001043 [Phlyctochytrium planicorne]